MRDLSAIALLFAAGALLTSTALGQSGNATAANDLPDSVAEARCRYATAACVNQSQSPDGAETVAQVPRRLPRMGPGRPPRPMMAYPMPEPSLRHAAIGGLIGFVLGVARPNTAPKDRLALGLIVGLVGAAVGAQIPSFGGHHSPGGPWPDEDEEMGSNKVSSPAAGKHPADEKELSQTYEPNRELTVEVSAARSVRANP